MHSRAQRRHKDMHKIEQPHVARETRRALPTFQIASPRLGPPTWLLTILASPLTHLERHIHGANKHGLSDLL